MSLINEDVKHAMRTTIKLLTSIDISLGRIATALEKQNEYNDNPMLKYVSTGGGIIKNDDSNKGSTSHDISNSI